MHRDFKELDHQLNFHRLLGKRAVLVSVRMVIHKSEDLRICLRKLKKNLQNFKRKKQNKVLLISMHSVKRLKL